MVSETMPAPVTGAMLEYLDELRESGETNMLGAAPWLQEEFGLSRKDASAALVYWMTTFGERHPRGDE